MNALTIGYKGDIVEFRLGSGSVGTITGVRNLRFEAFENNRSVMPNLMLYTEDYPDGERPEVLGQLKAGGFIRGYTSFTEKDKRGFDIWLKKDRDYGIAILKPEWAEEEEAEDPKEVQAIVKPVAIEDVLVAEGEKLL